jgi:hypothetical protein
MHRPFLKLAPLLCAVGITFSSPAGAQGYSIGWSSVGAGGGFSSASPTFQVSGTVGQADAGAISSATYSIQSGWWSPSPQSTVGVPPGEADLRPATLAFAGPNPVSSGTAFTFRLAGAARVHLEMLDVAGHRVRSLAEGIHAAGRYVIHWDATDAAGRRLPSGIYFLRLDAAGVVTTRRVVLVH